MNAILEFFHTNPIGTFAVLLAAILGIPPLFERYLKLPGLVGLLVAGIVLGPQGLQLLNDKSESLKLLSDIGLVYLLFVAGMEIDLSDFRRIRNRSLGFGALTFGLPLVTGLTIGLLSGRYGWNASILIGSLLASHTPLGYPIARRQGVNRDESVTVTIGGTIFTDISALLVLAVCVGIHSGEFSINRLIVLLISLAIYAAAVLWGLDWLGKEFFRRSGDDEGNQFLFVLLGLFLASAGAVAIGVEKIVGAFLAGLAVNDVIRRGPVKEKVEFVGSVLFIPIFFINMGLLIDLQAFSKTPIWLCLAIVLGLIASKFLAAFTTKWLYRYSWPQMVMIWSLSLPQVAATLAATLVGFKVGLLRADILNSVLVMFLVTATLGPFLTARASVQLPQPAAPTPPSPKAEAEEELERRPFTAIVPVSNPATEQYLIELAGIIASPEKGRLVPLAIVSARVQMAIAELDSLQVNGQRLLERAASLGQKFPQVETVPLLRVDDDVARGILWASREQHADLILMGWSERAIGLRSRLFGSVLDSVLWGATCPVAIARLRDEPAAIQRILVPVKSLTLNSIRSLQLAQLLARANQAKVKLLHVRESWVPESVTAELREKLTGIVEQSDLKDRIDIEIVEDDTVDRAIIKQSQACDLIILRSANRETSGGLVVNDVTSQVVPELRCSTILLGYPRTESS
jgi:Kef-type K+ transport system membrane component KefB/nucleotide-binding universal stress UspA family protein